MMCKNDHELQEKIFKLGNLGGANESKKVLGEELDDEIKFNQFKAGLNYNNNLGYLQGQGDNTSPQTGNKYTSQIGAFNTNSLKKSENFDYKNLMYSPLESNPLNDFKDKFNQFAYQEAKDQTNVKHIADKSNPYSKYFN